MSYKGIKHKIRVVLLDFCHKIRAKKTLKKHCILSPICYHTTMTEEIKKEILSLVYLYEVIGDINQEEFFERLEDTLDFYYKSDKIQP